VESGGLSFLSPVEFALQDGFPVTDGATQGDLCKVKKAVVISNPYGLHMRPAAAFARLAAKYQSTVTVSKQQRSANGKSLMSLMMLAAGPGTELILEVEGTDAVAAAQVLAEVLASPSPDGLETMSP
jgi:phosphocarrier protein HPr